MLGYDRREMIGQSLARAMDAETFRRHEQALQQAMVSRRLIDRSNLELVAEQGLFEPYRHGDQRSDQPMSMGLGLHVSRRLAELMSCTLEYRRRDGHTEFLLVLPLVDEPRTLPGVGR